MPLAKIPWGFPWELRGVLTAASELGGIKIMTASVDAGTEETSSSE